MESDDGGWTVFQRRMDGSVNFYREWNDYQEGFGNLNYEHWLGLDKLHRLTAAGGCGLRVEVEGNSNNKGYAKYSSFQIANAASLYTLTVSGYSGTAGDYLAYQNGMKFTTKDRDNDAKNLNCAAYGSGAWWYRDCFLSNLNGVYGHTYMFWGKGNTYRPVKFSEMKLRCNH